jgi:hypothetical protein
MSWFHRKEQLPAVLPPPSSSPVDINHALEIVLVNSVQSAAQTASTIGAMVGDQLKALVEIQQALFSRRRLSTGGRKRAKTAVRGEQGRFERGCRLCKNPAIKDPVPDEIRAHATHGYHADESQIVRDPADGSEVIECAECAAGVPGHTHQVH